MIKGDIFTALGLKIQGGIRQETEDESITMIAEITKVTPGSIADNCGQLQIGRFLKMKKFILRFFFR